MSGSRSWEGAIEAQLAPTAARLGPERRYLVGRGTHVVAVEGDLAAADLDRPEQEAVACEPGVEPAGALGERGKVIVAGGEADAGADRGEVVEVAPQALELEQDRAHACELDVRCQTEGVLAGVGVGDTVCDRAGGAGAGCIGQSFVERVSFGCAFEAAVACRRVERRGAGCARRRRGDGSGRIR